MLFSMLCTFKKVLRHFEVKIDTCTKGGAKVQRENMTIDVLVCTFETHGLLCVLLSRVWLSYYALVHVSLMQSLRYMLGTK